MSDPKKPKSYRRAIPGPILRGGKRVRQSVHGDPDGFRIPELQEDRLWIGEIVDVDESRWAAYVQAHDKHRPMQGWAAWLSPYCHPRSGFEGINFIPRRGAQCVIARIRGILFVLGFYIPSSGSERGGRAGLTPNFSGHRPKEYQPGDMVFGTDDGNTITLSEDGAITVKSRPLAQSMWLPKSGILKEFLHNWELDTDGGFLKWLSEQEPTPRSDFKAVFRDTPVEDEENQVHLEVGKEADLWRLRVYKRNGEDLDLMFEEHVDKEGNVTVLAEGNGKVTIKKDAFIKVEGDATLSVDGECDIVSQGKMQIASGAEMDIISVGNMKLSAPRIDLN